MIYNVVRQIIHNIIAEDRGGDVMGRILYLKKNTNENPQKVSYMNRKEIEGKALNLLINYDLYDIPVDPVKLAKKFNIEVKEADFKTIGDDTISGGIKKEDNRIKIYVNSQDDDLRKRFTIAHELGHYFLHFKEQSKFDNIDMHRTSNYDTTDPLEKEANQFAAALLMNEKYVIENFRMLKKAGFTEQYIISLLANLFMVSKSAMYFRLKNLGLV